MDVYDAMMWGLFLVAFVVILLERYLNYPFGVVELPFVLCPIPPFIKRIRIKNRWVGFDKHWKFVWLKELNKEGEVMRKGGP